MPVKVMLIPVCATFIAFLGTKIIYHR